MIPETPLPFQETVPPRTPEATARLAWLVLGVATCCFCALCALVGYGLWQYRANKMGPQGGNYLEVFAGPVSLIGAVDVRPVTISQGQRVPLQEGETVVVGKGTPPGVAALVMLWDGSTLQLSAGTRVTFSHLRVTRYSSRRQEVVMEVSQGRVLLGVSPLQRYQQTDFFLSVAGVRVQLEPGGTYLLRIGDGAEVAVRAGRAQALPRSDGIPVSLEAGQKVLIRPDQSVAVEAARWELLRNGDFAQGTADCQAIDGWTFRLQAGRTDTVPPVCRRVEQQIDAQPVWAVLLERSGANRDRVVATGILFQEMAEEVSFYQSVRLEFDLRIDYQSLPGGGDLGIYYPFAVRIHYRDARGNGQRYTYGFYYRTEPGYLTEMEDGEAILFRHDYPVRWQHFSLDLQKLEPTVLTGIELVASGHDYTSFVANVALVAE